MLAHQIAQLRKQHGLSQAQLGQELHTSPSAVGMYEQGRRTPNLELLIRMAWIFNVSLDFLVTGKEHTFDKKSTIIDTCPCSTCCWREYSGK